MRRLPGATDIGVIAKEVGHRFARVVYFSHDFIELVIAEAGEVLFQRFAGGADGDRLPLLFAGGEV
jgi:hypothetical protein